MRRRQLRRPDRSPYALRSLDYTVRRTGFQPISESRASCTLRSCIMTTCHRRGRAPSRSAARVGTPTRSAAATTGGGTASDGQRSCPSTARSAPTPNHHRSAPLAHPEGAAGAPVALALVVVAGLIGTAAGTVAGRADDGPEYAAALAVDLEARSRGLLTAAEAGCVADGMVTSFGEDRLQDLELIGAPDQPWPLADFSDSDERTFATVSYDCVERPHLADHLADSWFPARGVDRRGPPVPRAGLRRRAGRGQGPRDPRGALHERGVRGRPPADRQRASTRSGGAGQGCGL